jgi:cell division protein FtsB
MREESGTSFRRFRRPHRPGAPSLRRLVLVSLVVVLAYLLLLSDFGLLHRWQLARQAARERARIEELEARKAELERERERLTDPEYLERVAREEHGMVRPGEQVYRVAVPDTGKNGGKERP